MTLRCADDHQGVHHVQRIATLRKCHCRHRSGSAKVPVLETHSQLTTLQSITSCKGRHTFNVLSQLPVTRNPPCPGASIHLTDLMGASCWATCCDCPVVTSNIRPALSAPPERILVPSFKHNTALDYLYYTDGMENKMTGRTTHLVPAYAQYRALVAVYCFSDCLTIGTHFVDTDL